jgi:hypothetical protein
VLALLNIKQSTAYLYFRPDVIVTYPKEVYTKSRHYHISSSENSANCPVTIYCCEGYEKPPLYTITRK